MGGAWTAKGGCLWDPVLTPLGSGWPVVDGWGAEVGRTGLVVEGWGAVPRRIPLALRGLIESLYCVNRMEDSEMNSVETFRKFFGWCTVINFGIFLFTAVAILLMRDWMSELHGSMFGMDQEDVLESYFAYLANFKIVIIVFNLVPYLSLRMMDDRR